MVADELSRGTPLAPLLSAVHAAGHAAPSVGTVFGQLEKLAAAGPVLVTVDDVQLADQATMHAFRSLPRLLASYPLSWILTMAGTPHPGTAELLFNLLEDDGASRITLGPLDPEGQFALISDVLGAATVEEKAAKQIDFVKKSYDMAIANTKELADLYTKSQTDAFETLNARIAEMTEEVKAALAKK